jgi:Xaa-Pro aminopeptidase
MIPAHGELSERRAKINAQLRSWRADAFLVTALPNVRYLSGFTGSNGALLLAPGKSILFTDPRYQTQAPTESDCDVRIVKGPLLTGVASVATRMRLKSVGFEENRISYREHQALLSTLTGVRARPINSAVERLREIKSPAEIQTIRTSVNLNSTALEGALKKLKGETTEIDLAAEIEYQMRLLGADGPAFDTIVASGVRSALPHAHPSELSIQANQLLLIDMGARVAGYCSDMTRTYAVGKLNPKIRRMYRALLESQLAAIDAVRPGTTCHRVDQTARAVLRGHGLEGAFIHSTGHGLGLEIHEGPRVGRKDKTELEPGMVITIEPGVYIEQTGGVRIEDTVVVTASGCEVLTPTGKEFSVL